MTKRAEIAELLRAGATHKEIRQHVGGCSHSTITEVRRTLDIPVPHRPRPTRTLQESYALYTTPYGDGHARWDGPWAGRMPQICHPGKAGRRESALRIAFRIRHDREPIGHVRAVCGEPACVASGHLADRPMREHLKATLKAIFGQAS